MGGIMTLQGSTQTLHSSKLQVEEPSTPQVQNETEKNVMWTMHRVGGNLSTGTKRES